MRAIDIKQNRVRYHGEIFQSPIEAIDVVSSRRMLHDHEDSLNYIDEEEWTGYVSGEDFQRDYRASKCDLDAVKTVEVGIRTTETKERKRIQFYNDVCGFQPIVPLALMGVPTSMRNQRTVKQKSKIVDIVVDCTASCYVKAEQMAKASVSIVSEIMALEQQGYRVNLMAGFVSCQSQQCDFILVKIKDSSQPINLSRMLYPFSTASFVRRLGFAWYERTEGVDFEFGYGRPIKYMTDSYRQRLKDAIGKQTILIAVSDIVQKSEDEVKALIKDAVI